MGLALSGLSGISYNGAPIPDPITVTVTATALNDGTADGVGGTYPPTAEDSASTGFSWLRVQRSFGGVFYNTAVSVIRFDLSAYSGTVTAATLKLKTDAVTAVPASADTRSVSIEHYDFGAALTFADDWTNTAAADAFAGRLISAIEAVDGTVNSFDLLSPESIVLGGHAGFRLHASGGSPAGVNIVYFYSANTGGSEPQLTFTYQP